MLKIVSLSVRKVAILQNSVENVLYAINYYLNQTSGEEGYRCFVSVSDDDDLS